VASVDRVGQNVRDTLITRDLLTRQDRIVITADHARLVDERDPDGSAITFSDGRRRVSVQVHAPIMPL
jgi:hypothetical protein